MDTLKNKLIIKNVMALVLLCCLSVSVLSFPLENQFLMRRNLQSLEP